MSLLHADERELLISQAKAMRRTLRALLDAGEVWVIPGTTTQDALDRVNALIAKAEGRT